MTRHLWIALSLLLVVSGFFAYHISSNRLVYVRVRGETPELDFVIPMPIKDKNRLESLFRSLCFVDNWAYTLVGAKPVTFTGISKPFTHNWRFWIHDFSNYLEWRTWLAYSRYFSKSRFLIFEDRDPNWKKYIMATIIDRDLFYQVVRENRVDFQQILGIDDIQLNHLLDETMGRPFLSDVLKNHTALIGIVLGYGKENSWLYHEREEGQEILLSSVWEDQLLDEMIEQQSQTTQAGTPWQLSDLYYPSFTADRDSSESAKLREHYQKTREKIVGYYEGKDFLEATLSLMNSCGIEKNPPGSLQK
jgi:hypothetical protein